MRWGTSSAAWSPERHRGDHKEEESDSETSALCCGGNRVANARGVLCCWGKKPKGLAKGKKPRERRTVVGDIRDRPSLKVHNHRYGRVEVLRWLVLEAAMPALDRSANGALALHYAAARGCLDCVRLLVESSSELSANTQMDNDVTPVYLAAQEGHLDVLRYLVSHAGGSLYVRAKDGMAPLHAAAQMGCLACLKWMIQDQGVDANLRDGDGATPLHFAASRGHAETVRWLLRHGARLTLDRYGKSPINDAADNHQMECLNILVQHGTTPDYHDTSSTVTTSRGVGKARSNSCCRKVDATTHPRQCSCSECGGSSREPFYLHPPGSAPSSVVVPPQQDGLYVNPLVQASAGSGPGGGSTGSGGGSSAGSSCGSDPFYLHDPREVPYTRVKDLFDQTAASQPITVRVEVHSSSSGAGSDENLSHSDASENGAADSGAGTGDHDYEDIYLVRQQPPAPSMTASTESGVSSATPSDLGHSEEEGEKTRLTHRHSLPHIHSGSRTLKRVVSEPSGMMCPPPPPPPPPASTEVEKTGVPTSESPPPQPATTVSATAEIATPTSVTSDADFEDDSTPTPDAVVLEEHALRPSDLRRASVASSSSGSTDAAPPAGESGSRSAPNLVNKQMVLPFVPPRFPDGSNASDQLIKPSEYLRSLVKPPPPQVPSAVAPKTADSAGAVSAPPPQQTAASAEGPTTPAPPPPPPQPPAALGPAVAAAGTPGEDAATGTQGRNKPLAPQPLGAISIQELNSVQLRRTATKTMSAPPASNNGVTAEQPFLAQKEDLIAELKASKDITGIKKLKVERAKVEERNEKELFSEITRSLTANSFVEKIPDKDATGNPIPEWKRQMLAKKAAEKARKELEEEMARQAEEKRLQAIPVWKRQLLAKKDDTRPAVYMPKVVDDKRSSKGDEWLQATSNTMNDSCNKENKTPPPDHSNKIDATPVTHDNDEQPAQIIPWRAQLRKTNSKLSLLE